MNDKAFIEGKIVDIVTPTEYKQQNIYGAGEAAIHANGSILPVRGKYNPNVVGYYPSEDESALFGDKYVFPTSEEDKENYNDSHIANFNNVSNIQELMIQQSKINDDQIRYLSDSDNIFKPVIDPVKDTPIMVGLKQAVIDKSIDINKYASRFSKTAFNNDKRLFNKEDISLKKFLDLTDKLDMKSTLIIEDRNPNVPNPIGHKIVINLGGDDNE